MYASQLVQEAVKTTPEPLSGRYFPRRLSDTNPSMTTSSPTALRAATVPSASVDLLIREAVKR